MLLQIPYDFDNGLVAKTREVLGGNIRVSNNDIYDLWEVEVPFNERKA